MAGLQNVDELFPAKAQSVDELFPADVERDHYRRQTLGTSPIQDLIFGDTSVNPIARILDHFGQGAKQGWGAEPNGLSDESADALKKAGIFNDYDKGQKSIIKAANESLFRSAATYIADPIMRGLPAAFRGTQEAIAQTGEELGQPKLGREAAGALEALPTGVRAPTGIPHAPIKYLQAEARAAVPAERVMAADQTRQAENVGAAETNILMAEIERARDLKTIGAGEAGWKGTADVPAPTVLQEAAAVKPEVLESAEPVRPRAEPVPADAAPVDVAEGAIAPLDDRLKTFDEERRSFEVSNNGWIGPKPEAANDPLYLALQTVTGAGLNIEKWAASAKWAAENGRKDIAQTILDRAQREADRAKADMPGVAADSPRYAKIEADLKKRAEEVQSQVDAMAQEIGLEPAGARQSAAAPAEAVQRVVDETHPIAQDVAGRLVAAGRPAEEASAAGQLIASHYESRAARFEGALGSADELYAAEGADIKGRARAKELAQKPESGLQEFNQVTAYHGSPYDFEAFDTGKIGTGEGAQSYGHGLYFAESEGVAKSYRDALGDVKINGKPYDPYNAGHVAAMQVEESGSRTKAIEEIKKAIERDPGDPSGHFPTVLRLLESGRELPKVENPTGHLYKVNIRPEPHEFLNWDQRLSEQPKEIQRAVQRAVRAAEEQQGVTWEPFPADTKGMDVVRRLQSLGTSEASRLLNEAGVPGIRYLDGDSRVVGDGTHNYVVFDPKNIEITDKNGNPVSRKEFDQTTRGKIRIREDAKPIITLFKAANESTFIHETGHQWLEELMMDAQHQKAPEGLLADSKAVLDWFGVEKAADIKTRHHEQFARGFERYMMEGKAPTQGLARVFEKFKNWLTKIYQTVDRLKSPVNDEIRGVFDRLLAIKPEQVKIEPEAPKTFADIHEADALHTAPEAAHPVAETIRAERDRLANDVIPEEHDARLEGIASKTERREAGGPQPLRDGNEAPRPEEAGNNQASGAVGEGGSSAAPESARPSAQPRTEVPVSAQEPFKTESPLVDKAGNIRLDNLSTPEEVSQVIRDAATANNDFIDARRGVVTDGQVLELADALGMDAGQLNQRKLGQAFNAEQIMAARKLLIQSATHVRDAMAKAATGSEADIMAYAEAKTRHQMIQEQVAGLTAEAGRALRAFRKLEGQQEAGQIDAFLKDATGKTLFQLQREAQLGMQLDTPAQVSKFVNDSSKPTWKEMLIEAWMSALLSGPKTHLANIVGNTISGLWRPLETATASGFGKARNLVTGSEDRVLPGEAAAELFGMVQGSKEGIVAAYKAFKSEEPQLTGVRQIEQGHPKALPSATVNLFGKEMEIGGKQARIPLRLLGAEDEMFKSIAFRGDINRQAYAIAAKEGLPAEQFHARVAELSANPTEEMVGKAKDVAEYQTFQTPLGKVGRSVQNFANSHILAKLIVPFVRTPINLLKYAGERTPLGLFSQEVRDNLAGKNGAVARDTQLARITLGTMVGVAAFEMASQGLITGGGPADRAKKSIMQADGWQDYSIKIGDMYYRYNRLDPFSVVLGVAADAYEIAHATGSDHPDKEHLPALVFAAISKNILNRASLSGMSDLIQATADPERYGKNYVKGMIGTVVPALSAQTAQTLDPTVREARTIIDTLKARIPGLSETLMPRRDVWGEPIVREGGLGPDIASPIMEARLKNDPVNKALIAANYFPGKLDRKIRGVDLTDQQYDDYSRIAGRTAKVRLNAIVGMPGFNQMPETTRKELMTNAITSSREMARSLIMMQNPDIIKKANDAKMLKLRGEKVQ